MFCFVNVQRSYCLDDDGIWNALCKKRECWDSHSTMEYCNNYLAHSFFDGRSCMVFGTLK